MGMERSRIMIAGTAGDSGKTLLALGLLGAWRRRGYTTAAFKKGPDFIDTAWLGRAAQRTARNLDSFLMDDPTMVGSFVKHSAGADVAVIEGNRGLHDGRDVRGTHSTATLAALLQSPVILIHQVRKATRTAAAALLGCCSFDRRISIAGVVLNGVANQRHQKIITGSLALAGGPPVVGAIPQLDESILPGRHLGLVTPEEHPDVERVLTRAADFVSEFVDIDHVLEIARSAPPVIAGDYPLESRTSNSPLVRIGYFRDAAFSFYYAENLEALENAGAKLVAISPLADTELPDDVDGLYLGGGFPETHADRLANNSTMKQAVRLAAESGLPIFAECGGLVYLGTSVAVGDRVYPMAGVFPLRTALDKRPQGHGYCRLHVDRENPFFAVGTTINAHEFHYTHIIGGAESIQTACAINYGAGCLGGRDGLISERTMASYSHLHALGTPEWAPTFVCRARDCHRERAADPEVGCRRGDRILCE